METTKITLATVKAFVRKNKGSIYINNRSSFDGMIDGMAYSNNGFVKAQKTERNLDKTLGIDGAWFVGSSRDYLTKYQTEALEGIEVSNACGNFILAINK